MIAIDALVQEYAAFEARIHPAIAALAGAVCSRCASPCCQPRFCRGVRESAWLQRVAAFSQSTGKTIPGAGYLGTTGCTLRAGRPMECTWYICDQLNLALTAPLERFAYQVFSSLPAYVVRGLSRAWDLTEVDDLEMLTARQRTALRQRIRDAGLCCDRMQRLLRQRGEQASVDTLAKEILWIVRLLPFAARSIRFPGEQPSLSRRGRASLKTTTAAKENPHA